MFMEVALGKVSLRRVKLKVEKDNELMLKENILSEY